MAEELRAGRTALMAVLSQRAPGRGSSSSGAESRSTQVLREAEHFFSPRGSLEAVQDLKDTLFRGAARKLLGVSVWRGVGVPKNRCIVRSTARCTARCGATIRLECFSKRWLQQKPRLASPPVSRLPLFTASLCACPGSSGRRARHGPSDRGDQLLPPRPHLRAQPLGRPRGALLRRAAGLGRPGGPAALRPASGLGPRHRGGIRGHGGRPVPDKAVHV